MKIKSVRIENLRSIQDETVHFDDYTCFVGANGAGKSTILFALNVFFRDASGSATDVAVLSAEDFHGKNTKEAICITVTFTELSADAQEDFKDYFRQGELVVRAEAIFDDQVKAAPVKQFGQRAGMADFRPFFELLAGGGSAAALKDLFRALLAARPDIASASTKEPMIAALREYEAARPDECIMIPSEDQFYGVSKGANRLEKYLQWVFVPAVKDASEEQAEAKNTALGKLLARTVRSKVNFTEDLAALRATASKSYAELLASRQGVLTELSESLKRRLAEWSHPDTALRLQWQQDPNKSVKVEDPLAQILAGEHGFEGELSRFGHGLQRSYLLALLQELAGAGAADAPRLLLACEEPELYQHPPQARHLASVLKELPLSNSQVIVCTHSPFFVDGQDFERVRVVRKPRGTAATKVAAVSLVKLAASLAAANGKQLQKPSGVRAKIHQALQPSLNEIFFAPVVVLVEGLEDVAYITAYVHLLGLDRDFRRLGVHVVPANGKSHLIHPIAIANELGIPTFTIFDSDAHEQNEKKRGQHATDNTAILALCGDAGAAALPTADHWGAKCVMWRSELGDVVEADFAKDELLPFKEKARAVCGHVADLGKNSIFIAEFISEAFDAGKRSATLEKLCRAILAFAEKQSVN
jgi:putative ATP-dependent endonuclease of OLD family